MLTGDAYANRAFNLVVWGAYCESSDPPDQASLDYLDPHNPNGAIDIGSMQCSRNLWNQNELECKIRNGYPGYQAYLTGEVINLTKEPVKNQRSKR